MCLENYISRQYVLTPTKGYKNSNYLRVGKKTKKME